MDNILINNYGLKELKKFNSLEYNMLYLRDKCLVHRYRYYVMNEPIITDHEYDIMEKLAFFTEKIPESHNINFPGSDLITSYPNSIIEIAKKINYGE